MGAVRSILHATGLLCALGASAPDASAQALAPRDKAPALMPAPLEARADAGALIFNAAFSVRVEGCASPLVEPAVDRFQRDVARLVGVALAEKGGPTLGIRCTAPEIGADGVEAGERYHLAVKADGIAVEADGATAVMRALATLRQLVRVDKGHAAITFADVRDAPRFRWRGVMIDPARHFVSVETLKRQIDAMELVKLNVLHLHLSDNEGLRVESLVYPKLTAGPDARYYTQAEIRELIAYARDRGVRIVPEFDVPGHSAAILNAYPELLVPTDSPGRQVSPLTAAIDPTSESSFTFIDKLFAEMAGLFPDPYFHMGGDEVFAMAWQEPRIAQFMKAKGFSSRLELERYFHLRVRGLLKKHGKIMVGWDEVVTLPVPDDIVAQIYRNTNWTSIATARGNRAIVSNPYYLDNLGPLSSFYSVDPLDPNIGGMSQSEYEENKKTGGGALVGEGSVTKRLPALTEAQQRLVLGAEAPLWAEIVTDEMLDGRLWPAAAAFAERLWSPASVVNQEDMVRRLLPTMAMLRQLGLQDEDRRRRMAARLAPGESAPLDILLSAAAPIRNAAHFRLKRSYIAKEPFTGQEFIEPADIASVDSDSALRFHLAVKAYLGGDKKAVPLLKALLGTWRDNEAPFGDIARGRPMLEAVLPSAADLAALSRGGLAAINAIEAGRPMLGDERRAVEPVIERQAGFEAASANDVAIARSVQPSGDLLIRVAPDIAALVNAARKPGRR